MFLEKFFYPINAGAGAIITFNNDGSLNLNCSIVELGQGSKTGLVEIVSKKMKMKVEDIKINIDISTQTSPYSWKTAASRGTQLFGMATLAACDDCLNQLRLIGSKILKVSVDDIAVADKKIYVKSSKEQFLDFKDVVMGYKNRLGSSVNPQIIGRGSYSSEGLTNLNKETGEGVPGMGWTVGATGVVVAFNKTTYMYKVLRGVTVCDVGYVLNYPLCKGQIVGAMSMGVSLATREHLIFDDKGIVKNNNLRLYKPLRYMERSKFIVDFANNKNLSSPFGIRSVGEMGILGTPVAIANCLSKITSTKLNFLPLLPEKIWEKEVLKKNDTI